MSDDEDLDEIIERLRDRIESLDDDDDYDEDDDDYDEDEDDEDEDDEDDYDDYEEDDEDEEDEEDEEDDYEDEGDLDEIRSRLKQELESLTTSQQNTLARSRSSLENWIFNIARAIARIITAPVRWIVSAIEGIIDGLFGGN